MTVASSTDRATLLGNGTTTVFPLPFRFFANSEIQAWLVTNATGALTALTLGTHYTLIGAGQPEVNGNAASVLTMITAPTSLQSLFVQRVIPATQATDIVNQGRFFPEIHEDVFDRLTMLIQQANGESKGAIRVAVGDPDPTRLAPALSRANLLLGFDSSGNPITVAPASGSAAALATDLANAADPVKGAGQIGRGGQIVNSIAELRGLLKTAVSKFAFVTDYYGIGTGGGGPYELDALDTTSIDNGGTIIVASDGGRWKLALTGFVTLKQFGAKFDGVTSDTVRVQAALDWANSIGGTTLLADKGTSLQSGVLNIYKNTTLRGHGYNSTIFDWGSSYTGDGIRSTWPINSSTAVNIELSNLRLKNTAATNTGGGFVDVGGTFLKLDSVWFQGFKYGAIFDQSEIFYTPNCGFESQLRGSIWLVNGADHTVGANPGFTNRLVIGPNCQFNNTTTAGRYAIIDDGGVNHVIQGNNFNGYDIPLRFADVDGLSIQNNECEVSGQAPIVFTTNTLELNTYRGPCHAVSVSEGNTFGSAVTYQIVIDAIHGATFSNNLFLQMTSGAILLNGDDITGIVLDNNAKTITGSGKTTAPFLAEPSTSVRYRSIDATRQAPMTYVIASQASGTQTVTPQSMEGIYPGAYLICGNAAGTNIESVLVRSVTGTTWTGVFATAKAADWTIIGQPLNAVSGKWTPTILGSTTAGSHTYGQRWGTWEKTGNRINFQCFIELTAKDAAMAGNVLIGGIPFNGASTTDIAQAIPVPFFGGFNLGASYTNLGGLMQAGATTIELRKSGSTVALSAVDSSTLTATAYIGMQGFYYI